MTDDKDRQGADIYRDIGLTAPEPTFKYLAGGRWRESANTDTILIRSPIDDSLVGKVQSCTRREAEEMCEIAATSWQAWNERTVSQRADILHRADDLLFEHVGLLTDLLVMEIGKTPKEASSEVVRTAQLVHYFAEEGRRYYGEMIYGDSFPGYSKDKLCLVTREPYGAVLAISPFNYPLNLSASKIAPALITGNAVLFKPATQGCISALHMAELFRRAGVPDGVLNVITGKSSEIGDVIAAHPGVNMIAFTGSTGVGRHLAHVAGLKPQLQELGGKDAAIVCEDCDLALTVKEITKGAFSYSGQRCTAVKRVLVLPGAAEALVDALHKSVGALVYGDPREDGVTVGPLIADSAAEYVQELIDDAKAKGAQMLVGGERSGRYIPPTLLDMVTEDMRIAWEEPFGPVLPILRCESLDHAIEIANKSEYGLQSCVFTQDIDKAFHVGRRLEVGTVNVNGADSRGPDHFPFLGVKDSGQETQGVHYSIEAMTRTKAITLNLHTPH
jgi:glyceraldehyde-3-phosphate dehydrogenase (NADP+)